MPSLRVNFIIILYRELLTWGAGRFGQLGNSKYEDSAELQKIVSFVPSDAGTVVQVYI